MADPSVVTQSSAEAEYMKAGPPQPLPESQIYEVGQSVKDMFSVLPSVDGGSSKKTKRRKSMKKVKKKKTKGGKSMKKVKKTKGGKRKKKTKGGR
uniref:Uncharacterized protein n=1 Tax=Florenciella sp. virus SA2 TaxID=3240092 RepID=A0AB39JB74_9VIRU